MPDSGFEHQQKLSQGLSASVRRNLEVLQASCLDLNTLIHAELASNPVLEAEYLKESDYPDTDEYGREDGASGRGNDDEDAWRERVYEAQSGHSVSPIDFYQETQTLVSYLIDQLRSSGIEEPLRNAVLFLIESLNERGLFDSTFDELVVDSRIPRAELTQALTLLREFDPPGIAAFGMAESLLLQWDALGRKDSLTRSLIQHDLEALAKKRYADLAKHYNVSVEDIEKAVENIRHLQWNPASGFSSTPTVEIVPDIEIVENEDGNLLIFLENTLIPRLRLSDEYKEKLAESGRNVELRRYLKDCFHEARQLIAGLEQRRETLFKIAKFLIVRQEQFFRKGREFLVPLTMNEVAEALEVHQSTISRAVSNKFVRCPQGLFELRFFFSAGFSIAQTPGTPKEEAVSRHALEMILQRLIREEDSDHPLSDDALVRLLGDQGISIARRTVAKYRDKLRIPPSHLRKGGL